MAEKSERNAGSVDIAATLPGANVVESPIKLPVEVVSDGSVFTWAVAVSQFPKLLNRRFRSTQAFTDRLQPFLAFG